MSAVRQKTLSPKSLTDHVSAAASNTALLDHQPQRSSVTASLARNPLAQYSWRTGSSRNLYSSYTTVPGGHRANKNQQLQIHPQENNTLKTYIDHSPDAGGTVERSFCGDCGSPLFIRNPKHENAVIVTSGTLELGEEVWSPKMEFFCKRKAGWVGVLSAEETVKFGGMEWMCWWVIMGSEVVRGAVLELGASCRAYRRTMIYTVCHGLFSDVAFHICLQM